MLDIQNDALASTQASAKGKGKRKAAAVESDDSDDDSDAMHLDGPLSDSNAGDNSDSDDMNLGEDAPPVPMPASGGIQELREKLHAGMAQLKQKGRGGVGSGEPGSRDELLEERRQQRAAMRERRRKETKEKIRREEERKGKGKEKGKEKEKQVKGPQNKVRPFSSSIRPLKGTQHLRRVGRLSSSYPKTKPPISIPSPKLPPFPSQTSSRRGHRPLHHLRRRQRSRCRQRPRTQRRR